MDSSFLGSKKMIIVAVACVTGAGAAVWGLTKTRSEPEKPKVEVPQEFQVASLKEIGSQQRGFDTMREVMERQDLTDDQRRQIMEDMRALREERERKEMEEYFKASDERKKEILDKNIDEMQERWKEMEKRRAEMSEQDREKARERMQKLFGGGNASREERKTRSESRNPDERARRMSYWQAMQGRMKERGITPPQWGGPGGRGGGGGGRG